MGWRLWWAGRCRVGERFRARCVRTRAESRYVRNKRNFARGLREFMRELPVQKFSAAKIFEERHDAMLELVSNVCGNRREEGRRMYPLRVTEIVIEFVRARLTRPNR